MSRCTRYLLEKCKDIDIDEYINFLDFIDCDCFNDPAFAKEATKYIITNINSKIRESNIRRIIQCFTIPQLCRICIEVDSDDCTYEEMILKIIDHYKRKRLRSYRYYLKYMLCKIDDFAYAIEFSEYARQVYNCFDIDILFSLVNRLEINEYAGEYLRLSITSDISFKQLRNEINGIIKGGIKLDDIIRDIDLKFMQKPINVLFLKYLLRYFPNILKNIVQKIRHSRNIILFIEKHFPELIFTIRFKSIKHKCEYLIRSKKNHNYPIFNLIKKILEKFSTRNICKMILYF